MPPHRNSVKRCSLCGSSKHNVRGCPLPGAAAFRAAVLKPRTTTKSKGRKLRASGVAAQSRKPKCKVKKKQLKKKDWAAKRRKLYSGDVQDHSRRSDRQIASATGVDLQSPFESVRILEQLGFLKQPSSCPHCGTGGLHGFHNRPGVDQKQVYWRCDNPDCRAWTNALTGCRWLTDISRFRSLTPSRLLQVVSMYGRTLFPRRSTAFASLGHRHEEAVQKTMDSLRALEAQEAQKTNSRLRMRGDVEVDATSLRCVRISRNSEAYKPEIENWQKSLGLNAPFGNTYNLVGVSVPSQITV